MKKLDAEFLSNFQTLISQYFPEINNNHFISAHHDFWNKWLSTVINDEKEKDKLLSHITNIVFQFLESHDLIKKLSNHQ